MKSKTSASKQAQHSNISYTEDEKGRDKEEKQRKKEAWKRKALLAAGHRSMFARGCNLSSDTGQVLQVAAQGNQFLAEKTGEMEGERCKKATRRLISILKIDIWIVSDNKCKEKKRKSTEKKVKTIRTKLYGVQPEIQVCDGEPTGVAMQSISSQRLLENSL